MSARRKARLDEHFTREARALVDIAATERVAAIGRAHLATLSEERRAQLNDDWGNVA